MNECKSQNIGTSVVEMSHRNKYIGAGEIAQWLATMVALPEGLGQIHAPMEAYNNQ